LIIGYQVTLPPCHSLGGGGEEKLLPPPQTPGTSSASNKLAEYRPRNLEAVKQLSHYTGTA